MLSTDPNCPVFLLGFSEDCVASIALEDENIVSLSAALVAPFRFTVRSLGSNRVGPEKS